MSSNCRSISRSIRHLGALLGGLVSLGACHPGQVGSPIVTDVGKSVGTLVKTSGFVDLNNTCNPAVPPAPDPNAFFAALSPSNRTFPFVGFQIWRNTTDGCLESRIDSYRALVTFNMAGVSQLKGLVTRGELVVMTRALPSGIGADPSCVARIGGAATLQRFGPNVTLPPVSGAGVLTLLPGPTAFPSGNTVYALQTSVGTVSGASSPTTASLTGTGGMVFSTDVTSQVNAALNGGFAEMSWMLTGAKEGGLGAPAPVQVDCRTSYDVTLHLTHY